MNTPPLRAARLPGQSTLWTRTLDRLLRRMPDGPRVPAPSPDAGAIEWAPSPPPTGGAGAAIAVVEARSPVAARTWTAPRHLPELLTDPGVHRRAVRLAMAR
jgi:hypothetical protein